MILSRGRGYGRAIPPARNLHALRLVDLTGLVDRYWCRATLPAGNLRALRLVDLTWIWVWKVLRLGKDPSRLCLSGWQRWKADCNLAC